MACNLCLTALRYLTPIIRQSMKFRNMPEVERKHCCAIRKVLQHPRSQKGIIVQSIRFRDITERK
ncbi:hypothetical protein GmHk_08G023310 [Glycine max]|nr:hypothetical protein GmHk_08G023310 [Glycine max]